MSYSHSYTRRGFIKRAAVVGAACAAPAIVPASVFGKEKQVAPSERIGVGMIGVGRQARAYNVPQFLEMPDVQIVSVCDVDSWRLENAKRQVEEGYAKKNAPRNYSGCHTCVDFNEILARKDIDAVMISTPDHWHAPMALAAVEAGKDVSLEKPVIRCIPEGRRLVEAIAKQQRIFRVDSEMRSNKLIHQAAELVRNGRIGEVRKVTVGVPGSDVGCPPQPEMPVPKDLDYERWQGPAPHAPYTLFRVHKPQSYERPGWMRHLFYADGMITNWTAHFNDIAAWLTNLEMTGPVEIEGTGVYPPADSFWNVLMKFDVKMRFANGVEWSYNTAGPFAKVEGSKGWIHVTGQEIKANPAKILKSKIGPKEIHFPLRSDKENFIDSVKSRKPTLEPAEVGQRVTSMGLLGQIAIQVGGKLTWDPQAERFVGNDLANELLAKPIHSPRTAKS